jgi:hypothetical protein
MNKTARSRKFTAKQSARLGAYLAAGLGATTAATSTADAAIVNIDIGPSGFNIGGANAGIAYGGSRTVGVFPFAGAGNFDLYNNSGRIGLDGDDGLGFAINAGFASPRNFALGSSIDSSATFSGGVDETAFLYVYFTTPIPFISPNFGSGSFMGFKTAQGNYGWLEVTWDSKSPQFEILSGAYEDQSGVAILAGTSTAPIPEPSTWVAMAVFAGGAAFARWRQRRNEAQKDTV